MNQIIAIAAKAVEQAEEGNVNPLEVYALLKDASEELEKALKQIKELVEIEIKKGNNTFDGYEFKVVQGRRSYDFKTNNDWIDLANKKSELENKLKALAASGKAQIADPETGEVIDLPIVKYGSDFIQRTKIKQKA